MTKIISFFAAAAAVLVTSPALADPAQTLVYQGVTYVYTVAQSGKSTVITGEDGKTGRPFVLRVRNGWVEGTVDGQTVSFSTKDVVHLKPAVSVTVVASRR